MMIEPHTNYDESNVLPSALLISFKLLHLPRTSAFLLLFQALQYSKGSTNLTLQMWLARSLFAAGNDGGSDANHAECRRITQNLLRDNRDFVEGYCMRGLTFLSADEVDKAAPLLKEALKLNPDCAEAREVFKKVIKPLVASLENARELKKKYRFRDAIPVYKQMIQMIENDTNIAAATAASTDSQQQQQQQQSLPTVAAALSSSGIDPAIRSSIVRGLRKSTLMASIQSEYADANLKIREFKSALTAANSSLNLYHTQGNEFVKVAYLTRCQAYLDTKQFEKAAESMKNTHHLPDSDDRLENMRDRCEAEMKKAKRPDYYRILSGSPSVTALLSLQPGQCWKTCGDSQRDEAEGRVFSFF